MELIPPTAAIEAFWSWFRSSSQRLAKADDNSGVVQELGSRLLLVADFSWELGPGLIERNAFALSPGGDAARLAITRHIVDLAPSLPGWEFHPALPRKDWELRFHLEVGAGQDAAVDASKWTYRLHRFPDGTFDIDLAQMGATHLSDDDRWTAAVIALNGELGEARRLELIGGMELVDELDASDGPRGTPLGSLRDHLEQLRTRAAKPRETTSTRRERTPPMSHIYLALYEVRATEDSFLDPSVAAGAAVRCYARANSEAEAREAISSALRAEGLEIIEVEWCDRFDSGDWENPEGIRREIEDIEDDLDDVLFDHFHTWPPLH